MKFLSVITAKTSARIAETTIPTVIWRWQKDTSKIVMNMEKAALAKPVTASLKDFTLWVMFSFLYENNYLMDNFGVFRWRCLHSAFEPNNCYNTNCHLEVIWILGMRLCSNHGK